MKATHAGTWVSIRPAARIDDPSLAGGTAWYERVRSPGVTAGETIVPLLEYILLSGVFVDRFRRRAITATVTDGRRSIENASATGISFDASPTVDGPPDGHLHRGGVPRTGRHLCPLLDNPHRLVPTVRVARYPAVRRILEAVPCLESHPPPVDRRVDEASNGQRPIGTYRVDEPATARSNSSRGTGIGERVRILVASVYFLATSTSGRSLASAFRSHYRIGHRPRPFGSAPPGTVICATDIQISIILVRIFYQI